MSLLQLFNDLKLDKTRLYDKSRDFTLNNNVKYFFFHFAVNRWIKWCWGFFLKCSIKAEFNILYGWLSELESNLEIFFFPSNFVISFWLENLLLFWAKGASSAVQVDLCCDENTWGSCTASWNSPAQSTVLLPLSIFSWRGLRESGNHWKEKQTLIRLDKSSCFSCNTVKKMVHSCYGALCC